MKTTVFVSYRRADSSAQAQLIAEALSRHDRELNVFLDCSRIEPGSVWPTTLSQALTASRHVVVLIGHNWLGCSLDTGCRRIDDPGDWVRREVAEALRDASKTVLPVLLDRATMPQRTELPDELVGLVDRQAIELRSAFWAHDVKLLTSQFSESEAGESDSASALIELLTYRAERIRFHLPPSVRPEFDNLFAKHVAAIRQAEFVIAHEVAGDIRLLLGSVSLRIDSGIRYSNGPNPVQPAKGVLKDAYWTSAEPIVNDHNLTLRAERMNDGSHDALCDELLNNANDREVFNYLESLKSAVLTDSLPICQIRLPFKATPVVRFAVPPLRRDALSFLNLLHTRTCGRLPHRWNTFLLECCLTDVVRPDAVMILGESLALGSISIDCDSLSKREAAAFVRAYSHSWYSAALFPAVLAAPSAVILEAARPLPDDLDYYTEHLNDNLLRQLVADTCKLPALASYPGFVLLSKFGFFSTRQKAEDRYVVGGALIRLSESTSLSAPQMTDVLRWRQENFSEVRNWPRVNLALQHMASWLKVRVRSWLG